MIVCVCLQRVDDVWGSGFHFHLPHQVSASPNIMLGSYLDEQEFIKCREGGRRFISHTHTRDTYRKGSGFTSCLQRVVNPSNAEDSNISEKTHLKPVILVFIG